MAGSEVVEEDVRYQGDQDVVGRALALTVLNHPAAFIRKLI